jgi:hypothetical protein
MDKIFNFIGCNDDQKVRFATYMLEGLAELWWSVEERQLFERRKKKDMPISWTEFKQCFYVKYSPEYYTYKPVLAFRNLTQGSMRVSEYQAKFIDLLCSAPHLVATEAVKVENFGRVEPQD